VYAKAHDSMHTFLDVYVSAYIAYTSALPMVSGAPLESFSGHPLIFSSQILYRNGQIVTDLIRLHISCKPEWI